MTTNDVPLGEQIARAIQAQYLGPDAGRLHDGRESPDAPLYNAWDEGLECAAQTARSFAAPAPVSAGMVPAARLAEAWVDGALWAAVECGAIEDETQPWLWPGDNPYRTNEGADQ